MLLTDSNYYGGTTHIHVAALLFLFAVCSYPNAQEERALDHRLRGDHEKSIFPTGPEPSRHDPEQLIEYESLVLGCPRFSAAICS